MWGVAPQERYMSLCVSMSTLCVLHVYMSEGSRSGPDGTQRGPEGGRMGTGEGPEEDRKGLEGTGGDRRRAGRGPEGARRGNGRSRRETRRGPEGGPEEAGRDQIVLCTLSWGSVGAGGGPERDRRCSWRVPGASWDPLRPPRNPHRDPFGDRLIHRGYRTAKINAFFSI